MLPSQHSTLVSCCSHCAASHSVLVRLPRQLASTLCFLAGTLLCLRVYQLHAPSSTWVWLPAMLLCRLFASCGFQRAAACVGADAGAALLLLRLPLLLLWWHNNAEGIMHDLPLQQAVCCCGAGH